jgi:uncharacterized protein YjiS (DUF1127 family)
MNLLKTTLRVWAMHREFRAELNSHSDRKLAELVRTDGDIAQVAYEEAERRIVTSAASDRAPAPV